MTDMTMHQDWIGRKMIDQDGGKIGRIDQIYLDEATGQPDWVTVHTGLLGTHINFVPVQGARMADEHVQVPYSKQQVKDAPHIDPDGRLDPAEEQRLFQHYSMAWNDAPYPGDGRADRDNRRTEPSRDVRDMTRSEEELRVGKESVERGRARLRKYVVTENVQTTVPLRHEEVRVEREPVSARDRDSVRDADSIAEDQQEVVLHEERPMVDKEVVPKERVRLGKENVTEQRTIAEQVRKEQIDVDRRRPRGRRH